MLLNCSTAHRTSTLRLPQQHIPQPPSAPQLSHKLQLHTMLVRGGWGWVCSKQDWSAEQGRPRRPGLGSGAGRGDTGGGRESLHIHQHHLPATHTGRLRKQGTGQGWLLKKPGKIHSTATLLSRVWFHICRAGPQAQLHPRARGKPGAKSPLCHWGNTNVTLKATLAPFKGYCWFFKVHS